MTTVVDTIQQIIRHELRGFRIADLGVVEEVYPHSSADDTDNYGCDVRLKNSGLLLKRVPIATGHIGTAAIPNKDDLVLLTYDRGDVNQPIVIGRLYNDGDRSVLNKPDEVIFRLPLAEDDEKTIKAAIRNHSSDDPPREIIFEMPPKITVRVTDGTVRATAGKTEMKLDQPDGSGGKVTVFAGRTKITMDQDGDVTVEAAGAMTLKATKDITLDGLNIKLKSKSETTIDAGTSVEVKGNAQVKLQAQGSASLQSSGITEVKGSIVRIN